MKSISHPLLFSLLLSLLFSIPSILFGQSPQSIPYQAVVRNSDGSAMSSTAMTMIFKIHDVTATGTIVYQESHSTTSNAQGLVILQVGQGQASVGTFDNIDWGNGAKFLHVVMNAGNGEVDLGTQQMMSVPYALYAEKSGGSMPTGSAPGELMYWNGSGWSSIPPGGYGKPLCMCDGVPSWGGCIPKLGNIQNENSYTIYTSPSDTLGAYLFVFFDMRGNIISFGTLDVNPHVYNPNLTMGFEFSTDSLFLENVINSEGSVTSQDDNYFSIRSFNGANLHLATTYYLRAYCQNSIGIGYSPVESFTTPSELTAGCMDIGACNYNSSANASDGNCVYPWYPCDDNNANTTNDVYDSNCQCVGTPVSNGNATCSNESISVTACDGQTTIDYYGRTYNLVEIGSQCWFKDNLATDRYRNGDSIPTALDNSAWASATYGAFAIYNNDIVNDLTYGKLYNWYTTIDSRGLCPAGWHVPSDCEWMYLEGNMGISILDQQSSGWRGNIEGGSLKATNNWNAPNAGATNSSGFEAFPGGFRYNIGTFSSIGNLGYWWSSTEADSSAAWFRALYFDYSSLNRSADNKLYGLSVRCLKD